MHLKCLLITNIYILYTSYLKNNFINTTLNFNMYIHKTNKSLLGIYFKHNVE